MSQSRFMSFILIWSVDFGPMMNVNFASTYILWKAKARSMKISKGAFLRRRERLKSVVIGSICRRRRTLVVLTL